MVQLHTQPDQQQVQCQTYRKPSPNIIKTQVHRVCEVPAPTAASEKELVPSEIVARLEPQIESLRGQIVGKENDTGDAKQDDSKRQQGTGIDKMVGHHSRYRVDIYLVIVVAVAYCQAHGST